MRYLVQFVKGRQIVYLIEISAESKEEAQAKAERLLGKRARLANLTVRVIGPIKRHLKGLRMKYKDKTLMRKGK